jgi:hypothetical protein
MRPDFSVGWAQMAKYMQYLFNLQHNTDRIIIEQHVRLNAYTEKATLTSHHGTLEFLEKGLEL